MQRSRRTSPSITAAWAEVDIMKARTTAALRSALWSRRRTAGLALLCVASLWLWFAHIDAALPYSQHFDERYVAKAALGIMQSGSLEPNTFLYPSLPIYGATLGFIAGAIDAVKRGELGADVSAITRLWDPFYSHPTVMRWARRLNACLAALTLLCVGLLGAQLWKEPWLRLLAPLLLLLSPLFFESGYRYLNVDVWCSAFTLATVVAATHAVHVQSLWLRAVLPGLCAGCAIASKYNAVVVLIPCALGILFFGPRGRRVTALVTLGLTVSVTFALCCPYALLRVDRLIAALLDQMVFYQKVRGSDQLGDPSWTQLAAAFGTFTHELGPVLLLLCAVGFVFGLQRSARRTLVAASAPLSLLVLMSGLRLYFPRNMLPALDLLPVFAAFGALQLGRVLHAHLRATRAARLAAVAVPIAIGLAIAIGVLVERPVFAHFVPERDSRKLAVAWLTRHAADALVYAPADLSIDSNEATRFALEVLGPKELAATLAAGRSERRTYVIAIEYAVPSGPKAKRARDDSAAMQQAIAGAKPVFSAGSSTITKGRFMRDPKLVVYQR
jgi:4-amino-4-deoxy-L-arabinose transferase-like glycosyltransferase